MEKVKQDVSDHYYADDSNINIRISDVHVDASRNFITGLPYKSYVLSLTSPTDTDGPLYYAAYNADSDGNVVNDLSLKELNWLKVNSSLTQNQLAEKFVNLTGVTQDSEGKNILSKNEAGKIYSTPLISSDDEFKKFQGIFENGTYFQLSVFGVTQQGFDDAGDGGNG